MPKVGKIRTIIPGHTVRDYSLYYSQKQKFYITDIPEDFTKLSEFIDQSYETEQLLRDNLERCIRIAKEKLLCQRKVIAFRVAASHHLRLNPSGENAYSGTLPGISDKIAGFNTHGIPRCAFGVEYLVLYEYNDGVKIEYRQVNADGSLGYSLRVDQREYTIIDYTADREAFFLSIYDNMAGIVLKLSQFFFSRDLEAVLHGIDNKQLSIG